MQNLLLFRCQQFVQDRDMFVGELLEIFHGAVQVVFGNVVLRGQRRVSLDSRAP